MIFESVKEESKRRKRKNRKVCCNILHRSVCVVYTESQQVNIWLSRRYQPPRKPIPFSFARDEKQAIRHPEHTDSVSNMSSGVFTKDYLRCYKCCLPHRWFFHSSLNEFLPERFAGNAAQTWKEKLCLCAHCRYLDNTESLFSFIFVASSYFLR